MIVLDRSLAPEETIGGPFAPAHLRTQGVHGRIIDGPAARILHMQPLAKAVRLPGLHRMQ